MRRKLWRPASNTSSVCSPCSLIACRTFAPRLRVLRQLDHLLPHLRHPPRQLLVGRHAISSASRAARFRSVKPCEELKNSPSSSVATRGRKEVVDDVLNYLNGLNGTSCKIP